MQAAVQSGGPAPRAVTGPTSSQQLKSGTDINAAVVHSAPGKGKKRDRADQHLDPSKRERPLKPDDNDSTLLKYDRPMRTEDIGSITDKDGGLSNLAAVDRLVHLMQQERMENASKVNDPGCRRSMLAGVIVASEREDCLERFVQQGGLALLDDWLQEAQKVANGDVGSPKEGDKAVEELLLTLLHALDRLPVNLEALKTCVVGKSVNQLRSHKNSEIQKRARKLVDVWKKRVDAEMKLTGEGKSGSSHEIAWSCKQSSADLVHVHLLKSGAAPEVAVKSGSGPFPKANSNSSCPGDTRSIAGAPKTSESLSPNSAGLKDGCSKISVNNVSTDMPASLPKEEKGNDTTHAQNNGQVWSSGVGKGCTWKENVKSCTPSGLNPKLLPSGLWPSSVSGKAFSGVVSGVQKEMVAGRPLVWSRNAANDKACAAGPTMEKSTIDVSRAESSGAQGRLIGKIPSHGKSPARVTGGTETPTVQSGRGNIATVTDRQTGSSSLSMNLADVTEVKGRPQNNGRLIGILEASDETKATPFGGEDDKKISCARISSSDSENLVSEGTNHGRSADEMRKVESAPPSKADCSTEDCLSKGDREIEGEKGLQPHLVVVEEDVAADVGGISLLANVLAVEVSKGTSVARPVEGVQDRALRCSFDMATQRDECKREGSSMDKVRGIACESIPSPPTVASEVGRDVSALKSIRERVGVDTDSKGGNSPPGTGVSNETDTKQESFTPNVNVVNEINSDAQERRVPLPEGERVVTGAAGPLTTSQDVGDASRLFTGEEVQLCAQSCEAAPEKDSNVTTDEDMHGVLGNQTVYPIGGKSGRWEGVIDDRKLSRAHLKSGKRDLEAGGGLMSSENCLFEDDALQVAQQVGKEAEQDIKLFGKRGSSSCADIDNMGNDKVEHTAPVAGSAAVGISESSLEHRWQSLVESEFSDQYKDVGGAHQQLSARNAGCSDDSQETVTERTEDVADRATGLGAGEEVDQLGFSTDQERTVVATAVESDSLPVGGGIEKNLTNSGGRPVDRSSSDQAGHLQNLPQNVPHHVLKSGQRNSQAGEPTTPEQATEVLGPSDGPVGGSDASERPDFDLNEGIPVEEHPQDDASTNLPSVDSPVVVINHPAAANLTTPIAVVAATKGPFIPPASPMRLKGELGWKGSAATSAFRPAEPRRTPERQAGAVDSVLSSGLRRMRPPLDIDLNVVDERGLDDGSGIPSPQFQMSEIVLGLQELSCPKRSKLCPDSTECMKDSPVIHTLVKLDLDLNRADESEESGTLLMSDWRVPKTVGSSTETRTFRPVFRDFDLNDGPASEDSLVDDAVGLSGSSSGLMNPPMSLIANLRLGNEVMHAPSWVVPNSSFSAVALPSVSMNRAEPSYSVAAAAAQYLGARPSSVSFASERYRTGNNPPGAVSIAYPTNPPPAFCGYSFGSSFPFGSSAGFATSSSPYLESAGSTSLTSSVSSQTLTSGVLNAAYLRPPYVLGIAEVPAQDVAMANTWTRPSLDLNAGPESVETEIREDVLAGRQPGLASGQVLYNDQLKGPHTGTLKRKEPESAWGDSFKSGFPHSAWRH